MMTSFVHDDDKADDDENDDDGDIDEDDDSEDSEDIGDSDDSDDNDDKHDNAENGNAMMICFLLRALTSFSTFLSRRRSDATEGGETARTEASRAR